MTKGPPELESTSELRRLGYANPLMDMPATRWQTGTASPTNETVAEEVPIAFVYNGQTHVVMMATPADLADFAIGWSLTEDAIRTPTDFHHVDIVRYSQGIELHMTVAPECAEGLAARQRRLAGRTGCGICGAESIEAVLRDIPPITTNRTIHPGAIQRGIETLPRHQTLNAASGAIHAAAWVTPTGSVTHCREDVGRHNALDKLIGALLREGVDPAEGFITVTSRASFEMAQKAIRFGAPALVAISGPTGLAVRLAETAGLTLIGFARAGRFTVYTHGERLRVEPAI